ncbi:MAG TPA: hypothetical protein PLV17_07405 [Spirochaetota bacterium]|nr:hypothetical protein [Spirochaetota bacterium]HOH37419.1 hypothetical protein [Spirochaetota bacterium]HPW52124.1 hypothetical protein [Spirochaetota bacterium]
MKKLFFAAVAVFVVSGSSALYSQGLEAGGAKFGFYGGGGGNYAAGEFPSGTDAAMAGSYFFGVNGFYNLSDMGSLFGGLEYSYSPYKLEYSQTGVEYTTTVKAKFLDINLGFRFTNFQGLYFDGGLFVGTPMGKWKTKTSGDYSDSGEAENSDTKTEVGLLVGAGYLVPIAETADLNIGVLFKRSFKYGYNDGDNKLRRQLFAVKAGVEMKF